MNSRFVTTGLMLFALFFGAGNLIFPAILGQQAGSSVFTAMAGFLITGAGLPLLGVIAVGYSNSKDIQQLASRVAPWYGILFSVALYLAIGPLFATPRTATVAFEIGVVPFLNLPDLKDATPALTEEVESKKTMALAVFSAIFFAVSFWLSVSPGKLVDRVGKILTPVLLLTIAILVGAAVINPMGAMPDPSGGYEAGAFTKGILSGYETMDALASLVFAIIVIDAVRAMGVSDNKHILRLTTQSGLVACFCLAVVYVLIGYMGATSVAGIGMQESGAIVLSKSANFYFQTAGSVLLAVIVFLACLSTAVGLITACAEYFNRLIPISYTVWTVVFTLISFGFANIGLSNIIKLSIPALMLLYPLTMSIIALAFLDKFFGGARHVYVCTTLGTALIAIVDGWKTAYGMTHEQSDPSSLIMQIDEALKAYLPLYSNGLGWILPALIGFVVGIGLTKMAKK